MVKHIVFWKINKDGTAQQRENTFVQFREKTAFLQTIIPEIKAATVALNCNEGDVYHLCIDSVFESNADLQAYINHPEHLKVRAFLDSVSYAKVVFDYEF